MIVKVKITVPKGVGASNIYGDIFGMGRCWLYHKTGGQNTIGLVESVLNHSVEKVATTTRTVEDDIERKHAAGVRYSQGRAPFLDLNRIPKGSLSEPFRDLKLSPRDSKKLGALLEWLSYHYQQGNHHCSSLEATPPLCQAGYIYLLFDVERQ